MPASSTGCLWRSALGEEFVDRRDRESTLQPAIDGGKVSACGDAALLVVGDHQPASPQDAITAFTLAGVLWLYWRRVVASLHRATT